jgi:two-component system LytT family sensor kinase
MKKNKRYRFWRVFWVATGLYLIFGLIGILAIYLVPDSGVKVSYIFQRNHILHESLSVLFTTFFYYTTLNFFYRFFIERKTLFHFFRVSLIAAIVCYTYQLCVYKFLPEGQYKMAGTGLMLFTFTIYTLFYIGAGILIAYLTYLRDEKKQRKILEEQKMQLEVEKSQANFNFLKAQINPHFLHNTLNFLYAKSLPYSTELSEGILTLSDIMRYALSEGNAKNGKAPLKDEIEHVRNVIKIQQLRFSNKLNVQFDVEGILNGATIIPFVLITLVENAFKHGDLKTNEYPVVIKLKITDHLYFYCSNKKAVGPKELSTGIGLENIKKRLELAYGKNYSLNVKDDGEVYTTELIIKEL